MAPNPLLPSLLREGSLRMSFANLDVAAFIQEPPEFFYRGGMFHIRQRFSDSCTIERVMPPHVFFLAVRRAAECAKQHRFGSAEVIDFPSADDASPAAHG